MQLSIQEILTQAGAFVLLVWILKKYAWKPLLALLDERRDKIRGELDSIDRAKKDVEALRLQYEASRTHIEEEAREKLQQAFEEGKRIARQIQEGARTDARAILEKAKEDIALEVVKAKITLRDEIADLTMTTAERLIGEKLDAKKDKALVLHFMEHWDELR